MPAEPGGIVTVPRRRTWRIGKKIEARFDPLELTRVEIYCDGKPEGVACLVDAVVTGRTCR